MSGYAQAVAGVADMLTGASADAAYEAAYGRYYTSHQQMLNAANQKIAAEANINAIRQDRINTDTVIAMQQDKAEAQAKVAAAVSGTEGQSVDDVIYQTEVESSVAKQNNKKNADQQIENQLSQMYQAQSTLLAVDDPQVVEPSMILNIATAASNFIEDDTLRGDMAESLGGLFGAGDIPVTG